MPETKFFKSHVNLTFKPHEPSYIAHSYKVSGGLRVKRRMISLRCLYRIYAEAIEHEDERTSNEIQRSRQILTAESPARASVRFSFLVIAIHIKRTDVKIVTQALHDCQSRQVDLSVTSFRLERVLL